MNYAQKPIDLMQQANSPELTFDDKPVQVYYFGGTAYNLIADKYDGVLCKLKTYENGRYTLEGVFNNVNLFGQFNIEGKKIMSYAGGKSAFNFAGMINLGISDNSGFPPNTKAQFSVSLVVDKNGGEGIYVVGLIPGFFDYTQAGTINLFKIPKYD